MFEGLWQERERGFYIFSQPNRPDAYHQEKLGQMHVQATLGFGASLAIFQPVTHTATFERGCITSLLTCIMVPQPWYKTLIRAALGVQVAL